MVQYGIVPKNQDLLMWQQCDQCIDFGVGEAWTAQTLFLGRFWRYLNHMKVLTGQKHFFSFELVDFHEILRDLRRSFKISNFYRDLLRSSKIFRELERCDFLHLVDCMGSWKIFKDLWNSGSCKIFRYLSRYLKNFPPYTIVIFSWRSLKKSGNSV
jgi:hypothetical protein